jgi:hypothetical protein
MGAGPGLQIAQPLDSWHEHVHFGAQQDSRLPHLQLCQTPVMQAQLFLC